MKSTLQLELVVLGTRTQGLTGRERVQLVALKVPAPLLVMLTVPVGVVFVSPLVASVVVVLVVGGLLAEVVAEQFRTVVVERFAVTVTTVVPELPRCVESPP